jgi:hypothetical protein
MIAWVPQARVHLSLSYFYDSQLKVNFPPPPLNISVIASTIIFVVSAGIEPAVIESFGLVPFLVCYYSPYCTVTFATVIVLISSISGLRCSRSGLARMSTSPSTNQFAFTLQRLSRFAKSFLPMVHSICYVFQ